MPKHKGPKKRKFGTQNREPASNPFDRLSSHKKFDVLGRKKGAQQEKTRLRGAAHELRKNTLLVEYKQLRKSNAFIDRRFGEDDDSLTTDEKALLRFQKQRMQELAGGKFALPDETEEVELTHLGRSLAEAEGISEAWQRDDDDDGLPAYDVNAHFGGGDEEGGDLFRLKSRTAPGEGDGEEDPAGDGTAPPPRRSKAEVMEEVIAKSKAYRAAKQQQREEDVEETDALDSAFRELGAAGALAKLVRPKGIKSLAGLESREDVAFDIAARELVYEAKGGPADRLKSQEEIEAIEKERLAKAEAGQRRRAKAPDTEEGSEDDEAGGAMLELPSGGFAARRARANAAAARRGEKRKGGSGDALEDEDEFDLSGSDSEGSSDDEGESGDEEDGSESESEDEGGEPLTALDARRRARAAGSDPLQAAFREAAKRLLKRHKGETAAEEEEEGEEEGDSDEGDSEEGDSEESEEEEVQEGSQESDSEESGSEESDVEVEEGVEEEAGAAASHAQAEVEEEAARHDAEPSTFDVAASEDSDEESEGAGVGSGRRQQASSLRLPADYTEFARLTKGLSPTALGALVGDLRATHAAALSRENRAGMQTFYGLLTQHYASRARGGGPDTQAHLDALLPHLLELTPQVPFYAASLARARLRLWADRVGERLASPAGRADAWPAPGVVAVLLLFLTLFPPSDRRHPVLTPLALLAGRCLTLCPVTCGRHLATGLVLAGALSAAHTSATRFAPEPLEFATRALRSVLASEPTAAGRGGDDAQDDAETDTWLRAATLGLADTFVPPSLSDLLAGDSEGRDWDSPAARTALACVAARQAARAAAALTGCDAAPEALAPALAALEAIAAARGLPAALVAEAADAARTLRAASDAGVAARKPLVLASALRLAEARQYNPRFEDGFVASKDYDPDRERAERRKLQRQVRKEQRGAARELRKDGAFMAAVRDKEKATKQASLDKSAKRAISFLQQQESDFKSGGQGGMWKKGKKF